MSNIIFLGAILRLFFLLLLLMMLSGQTNPASLKGVPAVFVSLEETAQLADELEAEKEQRRSAEFAKEVAEAKTDILKAGNSRLENWIGLYGLLIAAIAIFAGWFTRNEAKEAQKQATAAAGAAGEEATKAAKLEMLEFRGQAQTILNEIRNDHATVRTLTADLQERVNARPGDSSEGEPDAKEKLELKEAVALVKAKPEKEWSAQEFRLLLYDVASNAKSDEDWQEYVRLAQGMAFLHSDDEDDIAFALFAKAFGNSQLKKFETASLQYEDYLSECPNDGKERRSGALNNLGLILVDQAQSTQGAEADALWGQAYNKFAEALRIKPDMYEALSNWGNAVHEQAESKQGAEADALWSQAYGKFAEALQIKPDYHEALNIWGSVLAAQASRKQGAEADALRAEAFHKFAAALLIKPDKSTALSNWGSTLSEQARSKQGAEADALWAQAYDKFAEALKIEPDMSGAFCNLGNVFAAQAKTKKGVEADSLFAQAYEKYRKALDLEPNMYEALRNWGSTLITQAHRERGAKRTTLLDEAHDLMTQLNKISEGSGSYNLACIEAARDNAKNAAKWLIDSKNTNKAPNCEHIANDRDFDKIRDEPEFKQALKAIGCAG